MLPTVLDRVATDDVITRPFPHIVIRDALPPALVARLVTERPPFDTVLTGRENPRGRLPENTRVHYVGQELLADPTVASLWKEFVAAHTSAAFFSQLLRIFSEHIRRLHPELERRFGALDRITTGVRYTKDQADLLLDSLLVFNTPVVSRLTSVRGAHLDSPRKLFTGLLYLRDDGDRSQGGDLELHRFRYGQPGGFMGYETHARYVDRVKTIPYDSNVLVLFLNSLQSVHGVSVRHPTPFRRCYVSLVGELKQPLFDLQPYQELRPLQLLRRLKRRGQAWWAKA